MLGVFNSSENSKVFLYALASWIVIFFVNFASYMVQLQGFPTYQELWISFWESIFATLIIYCANKGIQWKRKEA